MKNNLYLKAMAICLALIVNFPGKVLAQQFLTTIDGWNAYVHLPAEYADSTHKKYPLICFLPGIGETGTNAAKLLVHGPAKFIAEGHNMEFMVNGNLEKPIVISLQPSLNWTSPWQINPKLELIMSTYRIDNQRINLTGLSMGGQAWSNYVGGASATFTNRPASLVIMSAPPPDNGVNIMAQLSNAGAKWWGFEGTTDYRQMDQVRDAMNNAVAGSARYTKYTGGHCCWNTWYNPDYNENGESIYTWMLKQRKPAVAASPLANAGSDTLVPVVTPVLALKGSGNDPNGYPISFAWTKLAGPASGTIANTTVPTATATDLVAGTYKFELRVINNLGAVGRDTVTVINGLLLPVKLINFTGFERNGKVTLNWKTAAELNSSEFIIERSKDSRTFIEVGSVQAAGNSNVELTYSFIDLNPETGMNYYRLKMVDIDGSKEYSNLVTINYREKGSGTIRMNGTRYMNNQLQLQINSSIDQHGRIYVTDISGKILYQSDILLIKGNNMINRNLLTTKGIYYTKVVAGEEMIASGLIHQ